MGDAGRASTSSEAPLIQRTAKKAQGILEDFKTFINQGNVVDLAVGLIIGAAFSAIVSSLVDDILGPFIGLLVQGQLEEAFVVIKDGDPDLCAPNPNICKHFKTRAQAKEYGAVTLNYGVFIQATLNFLIVAIVMFFTVRAYTAAFLAKKKKADAEGTETEE
ncbi:hypothetical protein HK102_005540, partial [Quaeritorhiza haematococci]